MDVLKRLNDKSLFILSLFMTVVASYFSTGFLHPDEQYYAIDFAAFKAGILGSIDTWEYQTKLRPWLLPAIFTPFLSLFKFFSFSPFTMAWMLRLLSGIVSWWALVRLNKKLKDFFPGSISYNIFIFFTHFSFFCFFMRVRANSENWSTAFILFAISLLIRKRPYISDYLIGGLFFGLAFSIRHQSGLIVLGFGLWLLFVKQVGMRNWLATFVPAVLLGVGIGVLADTWGYGELTFTPYNYIYQNLILDKISQFGSSPFYSYLLWTFKDLTPLWFLVMFIGFWRTVIFDNTDQNSWVTWSVVPFVLVHLFIGHKELRFLYPVAPFLLYGGAHFFYERKMTLEPLRRFFYKAIVFINLPILLFVLFKPAYTPVGLYQYLYENFPSETTVKVFQNEYGTHANLEMPFYKRKGLSLIVETGMVKEGLYLTTRHKELENFTGSKCERLYSTYPIWMFKFNFTDWLSRSSIWILSKCQ
jgi:phosphatidylinositol glycan class B